MKLLRGTAHRLRNFLFCLSGTLNTGGRRRDVFTNLNNAFPPSPAVHKRTALTATNISRPLRNRTATRGIFGGGPTRHSTQPLRKLLKRRTALPALYDPQTLFELFNCRTTFPTLSVSPQSTNIASLLHSGVWAIKWTSRAGLRAIPSGGFL